MNRVDLDRIRHRLLIHEASRWLGVHESGGANRGQDVERFQRSVDGRASGEPWCAAFAMFCITQVDSTISEILDQSYIGHKLYPSELVMNIWNKSDPKARCWVMPGALMVWQHYKAGVATMTGHIGIVSGVNGDAVQTIEGNTSGDSSINRDGDGVFSKTRTVQGSESMRVMGFLDPWYKDTVSFR